MLEHIVLDLDECCIHTYDQADWNFYATVQKPEHYQKRNDLFILRLGKAKMLAVKRPHLDEFLTYCFANFKTVSVWSAGTAPYVHAVVAEIFRDFPSPHLVLTREHTLKEFHEKLNDFYSKPLYVFFEHMPGANKTNTVLIDNKYDNSKYDPNNILHVPDFVPKQTIESFYSEDDCFPLLMRWLEMAKQSKQDVRDLYKADLFLSTHEKLINDYMFGLHKLPISWLLHFYRHKYCNGH